MVPKSLSLHAWKLGDKIWSEKQNGYLGFQETVRRGLESKLFSWYVGKLKFTLTFVWLRYWMSSEAKLTGWKCPDHNLKVSGLCEDFGPQSMQHLTFKKILVIVGGGEKEKLPPKL